MKLEIENMQYPVVVERKKNKNTYIRVREDGTIYVTTNRFVSNSEIERLLNRNKKEIERMIEKRVKEQEKNKNFYYLGNVYDIIIVPSLENMDVVGDKIYVKNEKELLRFLDRKRKELFSKHYEFFYQQFEEKIPMPSLKIRAMKTRWGVCNKKSNTITLNANLIKYPIECLDYVIIHELSHLVHFNHSKDFWMLVEKYCPEYKRIRKLLKE